GIVAVLTIAAGTAWWLYARCCESTDDAFISARAVAVAAQVSGAIVDVHVTDNELVGPGASLARVDDRDFATALAQARAQVDLAMANVDNLDAQIDQQSARIDQARKHVVEAKAAYEFAKEENRRAQELLQRGVTPPQQAEQKAANFRQSE